MSPKLILKLTDLEFALQDLRAGIGSEKEVIEKLKEACWIVECDEMAEKIDEDLKKGKAVFGRKIDPKTGLLVEVKQFE